MAATEVTYNGVVFKDVLTEDISQDVEYDRTGVDPLYNKISITIRGIVANAAVLPSGHTMGARISLNEALEKLAMPRRQFIYRIDERDLFNVKPSAPEDGAGVFGDRIHGADINNGPKPKFQILKIVGGRVAHVRFTVELAVALMCKDDLIFTLGTNEDATGLINLRFWIADDIDCEDWITTRTYHGRMRVRDKNIQPHHLRNVVFPPLQIGFKRQSISLREDPDGVNLEFTIVDKEMYAVPPSPATGWDGHFQIISPQPGGPYSESEMLVSLSGPKSVDKRDLFSLAAKIIDHKMHFLERVQSANHMMMYFAFKESLSKNRVEAIARVRHLQNAFFRNAHESELGVPLDKLINPLPGYNKEKASLGDITATVTGLFLSKVQVPCKPASMPKAVEQGDDPSYDRGDETSVTVTPASIPPYDEKYDSSHKDFMYTSYNMASDYDVKEGKIPLPFALGSSPTEDTFVNIAFQRKTVTRKVMIEAERLNKSPDIPELTGFEDENGIRHTLLSSRPSPVPPVLSADGVKSLHRTDMVLEYALSRAPAPGETYRIGRVPYNGESVASLPSGAFIPNGSSNSIA